MAEGKTASGNELPTSGKDADAEFRARIGEAVDLIGSAKLAGSAIGVSEDTISRWRQGPTKPPFTSIVALCEAAEIRVEWMATGTGPRSIQPTSDLSGLRTYQEHTEQAMVQSMDAAASAPGIMLLPQLAAVASAGTGIIPMAEHVEGYVALREEYLREIGVDPRYAHVLRVSGRSMAPTINDRDIVVVDTSVRTPVSEGVYTLVYGDAVLIKRIRLLRDGGVTLVSNNKSEGYGDEQVPRSELSSLHIVGRVKGHIRAL